MPLNSQIIVCKYRVSGPQKLTIGRPDFIFCSYLFILYLRNFLGFKK